MVLDARKDIEQLANEWAGCQKCELHVTREYNETEVLLGGGEYEGIMFIGESPSYSDNRKGAVFSDKESRATLLHCVEGLKMRPVYFTYLLACQSNAFKLGDDGEREVRANFQGRERYVVIPQPPAVLPLRACRARLNEEIYIVDPVLIVALGATVAASLSGQSVSIKADRGTTRTIAIPGVTHVPNLSKKKKEWTRKVKGVEITPVDPFLVRYQMLITHSITEVWDASQDDGKDNAFDAFVEDMIFARSLYRAHHEEVTGVTPDYDTDPDIERPDP